MRETTPVAAALTGVAVRTIRRWACDGRITVVMESGCLLVHPREVLELDELRRNGRLQRVPHLTGAV